MVVHGSHGRRSSSTQRWRNKTHGGLGVSLACVLFLSRCGVDKGELRRSKAVYCGVWLIGWLTWPNLFYFPAWRQNQPDPVFADVSEDEKEDK